MTRSLDDRPTFSAVSQIMLYLTEQCNLRCTYCFVDKKPRRMTLETAQKAVDYFLHASVSSENQRLNINFFGGEPFLELDLMEEVIAYAKHRGQECGKEFTFSATTNGTIASPRVKKIIQDNRMHLLVSVDGGTSATEHRPFVSGRSSYPLLARNLIRLSAWSPHAIARMTFHPDALDLVGNANQILNLGARSVAMSPVLEADWQTHEKALEAAYDAIANWYIDVARDGFILPLAHTNMLLHQYHSIRRGRATRPHRSCGVGTKLLGIDPDGNVMPCHRFLYRPNDWLGSVDETPDPSKRRQYVQLSSRDFLGCNTCPAEPICGGGCRVVALNAGLGLSEPYAPYCITMRAHARAVYRIYDTLLREGNFDFIQSLHNPVVVTGSITELVAS